MMIFNDPSRLAFWASIGFVTFIVALKYLG